MRSTLRRTGALLLLGALSAGCTSDGEPVLAIDASGGLAGLFFVDRNGDGELTAGTDVVARDLSFALVRGASDTVGTGKTDQQGVGVVGPVPVGSYRVVVDEKQLGDSLRVADSGATAVVKANAATSLVVPLQHPTRPIREILAMEAGNTVALSGVALSGWATFGDSTVHVADTSGVIRAVRVRPSPVVAGDSVRLLGRTAKVGGKLVLTDATVLVIGQGTEPVPTLLTTAQATTAQGGKLAGALVRIEDALVTEARVVPGGDLLLEVNDGTGVLDLLLDRHAHIDPEDPLLPGARVDATGVLVPTAGDPWQLKPRSTDDVEAHVPAPTIEAARTREQGQVVSLTGVALNGFSTFGDGSVHMADATGSIRVLFSTRLFIEAGDSLTVVGTIQFVAGQPVLSRLRSENHGSAKAMPGPVAATTGEAATADGGELDAALVQIAEATITLVRVVTGETQLVVNDGTGALTVVLDRDAGIDASGFAVGETVEVIGVLVPAGTSSWILKPRSDSDVRRPE